MDDDLAIWHASYARVGVATIPVFRDSKQPVCDGWNEKPPGQQWNEAGELAGNLAIVGGGPLGLGMIDADSRRTVTNVRAGLAGLGIPNPIYHNTTHAGRARFLVRLDGVPDSLTWTNLPASLGPGELRFNAPSVAPCSHVNGRWYQFGGGLADVWRIPSLPVVRYQDVSTWLIPKTMKDAAARVFTGVPVRLLWRPMPGSTAELLRRLQTAWRGIPIKHHGKLYPSRSEAECSVMADLILCAWQRDAIYQTFAEFRPGHYSEIPPKHATAYLDRTFENVLQQICTTAARLKLAECWQNALQRAWPGNGGALDRRVYLAVVALAWQRGKTETPAALRDIAQHAACSVWGVQSALRRLCDAGLLFCASPGSTTDTAVYRVLDAVLQNKYIGHNKPAVHEPLGTQKDDSEGEAVVVQSAGAERLGGAHLEDGHYGAELFTPGKLGRSAGLVYSRLCATPLTIAELVTLSGKSQRTVYYVLDQLEHDGLARREAGGWVRGMTQVTTLETLQSVRADERQAQRRARIEKERVDWAEKLGKG